MLIRESELKRVISQALLEFDFTAAAPPSNDSGSSPPGQKPKKMTKKDAVESVGLLKTVKPEEVQAAAPGVLMSIVNDEKLPSGYGKIQTAVATNSLKKFGVVEKVRKWKQAIKEQDKDEYLAAKAVLITRLGKLGELGAIVTELLLPDDMVKSVATSIGKEFASSWGTTVASAATSGATDVGLALAKKGSFQALKTGAKAISGTIITLLDLYNVADFAMRDAGSREALRELVKKTFSVKYGRENGTKFKLTKNAIKVVSYSA